MAAAVAPELLGTAERTLLAPFDLETGKLERVFGALGARRIDYADLYFQYTRSEGWSLEEGIVKSGSFNIEQGVGVRAVSGEKTAFAYSDEISFAALEGAGRATRAPPAAGPPRGGGGRGGGGGRPLVRLSVQVIAEHEGRRETGASGGGGRTDYAHFTDAVI